jgi:hypothetical protein
MQAKFVFKPTLALSFSSFFVALCSPEKERKKNKDDEHEAL